METLKLSLVQPTTLKHTSRLSFSTPIRFRFRCTPNDTSNNPVALLVSDHDRLTNPASPWLMLPSVTDKTTGAKLERFYNLADGQTVTLNRKNVLQVPDTAKCIASTMGGWLGYVDTNEGKVYLSNPFLKDVLELPSLDTLPCVLGARRDPITNEILHFKIRSYYYNNSWNPPELDPFFLVEPKHIVHHLSSLALSDANPRHCDTVVMALKGMDFRRLAYCHIGRQFCQDTDTEFDVVATQFDPNSWTGLQEDYVQFPGLPYSQLVYDKRRKLFYAMFDDLGILAFDVQRDRGQRSKMVFNFRKRDLVSNLNRAFEERYVGNTWALKELRKKCTRQYYLVTLENGDLLLMVRHYETLKGKSDDGFRAHKTLHFDVFRVVYDGYLERVTCLGNDRAIFIGWNQSFCIQAGSSPGVRPNCVYFTDDVECCYNVHSHNSWGHDTGIFNVEDGTITSFYPYEDEDEEKKVAISVPLFWVAPLPSHSQYFARECGIDDDEKLSRLG